MSRVNQGMHPHRYPGPYEPQDRVHEQVCSYCGVRRLLGKRGKMMFAKQGGEFGYDRIQCITRIKDEKSGLPSAADIYLLARSSPDFKEKFLTLYKQYDEQYEK